MWHWLNVDDKVSTLPGRVVRYLQNLRTFSRWSVGHDSCSQTYLLPLKENRKEE